MRRLIFILLVLVASVWLSVELASHPGYVLFSYEQWVVKLPLLTAFLGLIFIFLILHFSLRFLSFIFHLDKQLAQWFFRRGLNKAYDKTQRGLLNLMEEQWAAAERCVVDGIHQTKSPVINYLAAAEAAHAQKAFERSDDYLQKAYRASPQDELVIGLVQVRLLLEQGQLEQARARLTHLRQLAPHHPGVLKLLEKMYVRLSDWQNLLSLLPLLSKAKIINTDQYLIFEKNIYNEMLAEAERKNLSIHDVRELWSQVPKKIRLQAEVLERYAYMLKGDKASADELEPLIRSLLQKEWHEGLAKVYGLLATSDPARQFAAAEAWIKHYGNQNTLLLTLGRLALRCHLWGKARHYLEEALKQQPHSETQLELARLLEQLGETQLALRHYKKGLELATEKE